MKVFGMLVSVCLATTPLFAQSAQSSSFLESARAFSRKSQLDSVAHYAHRAITVSQQNQQWNDHAYALTWLGDHYRREQRYDSAFHYQSLALVTVVSNEVHDTTLALTYHQVGLYYKDTRQPAQAIQMYEKAISVREALRDSVALAASYNALATVYRFSYFDYIKAEQNYQRALQLLESSDHTKEVFDALYSLATTYRLREDYDEALAYGYRAITLAKDLSPLNQEVCFTMIGNILQERGDTKSAIVNFKQALSLGIKRLGNSDPSLVRRFNNLGHAYVEADSLVAGVQMLKHALTINASAPRSVREDDLADTYEYLGDAYLEQNRLDSANRNYHQSLAINRKAHGPKHRLTSNIFSTLGNFHQQQQALDSALYYVHQSLVAGVPDFNQSDLRQQPTVAMMQGDPLNFQLLYQKARIYLDQYQQTADAQWLSPALVCFARADSLIDSCRVLYNQEAAKLSFLENNKKVYEAAVECAYQLYALSGEEPYLDWAFHFMEKSKAMVLWEALINSQIKSGVGIPDSLLEREQSINVALAYTNNELLTARQPDSAVSEILELRAQQFSLTRQRERLAQQLQHTYPAYFQIKYGDHHYTLAQARDYARTAGTTLVEYLWGSNYVYALGISSQRVLFKQIALTDTLQENITTVLHALQHPPLITQSREDFQLYSDAAYRLYEQLLYPLLEHRSRKSRPRSSGLFESMMEAQEQVYTPTLTIIPDGPLSYLPFEALTTERPSSPVPDYRQLAYVLDKYATSYAQSAQVLTQRTVANDKTRNAMRFLGFGYSSSPEASSAPRLPSPWQELPGTTHEIEALGQMAEGTFFLGGAATESRFKEEAKYYDLIHLAVHGLADTLNPNNSRLVFRADQDTVNDGLLYSYELYDLQLHADLAVLSSCESGAGRWQQGEGVYSLARGFTYAGCPTVVMSLWKVDDQQTAKIMPSFYRGLFTGDRVDQALRTAKLLYRQRCSHFFAHPAFWSAFVAEGNPFPIVSYQYTHHAVWLILLLSAVYFSLSLRRAWKVRQANRRHFA